jgi:hypothetical protein
MAVDSVPEPLVDLGTKYYDYFLANEQINKRWIAQFVARENPDLVDWNDVGKHLIDVPPSEDSQLFYHAEIAAQLAKDKIAQKGRDPHWPDVYAFELADRRGYYGQTLYRWAGGDEWQDQLRAMREQRSNVLRTQHMLRAHPGYAPRFGAFEDEPDEDEPSSD